MVYLNSSALLQGDLNSIIDESLQAHDVDLTNCDREPIHIPNSIQPHGLLTVFDQDTLEILQVSANIQDWTGLGHDFFDGKTLTALLDLDDIQIIAEQLSHKQPYVARPIRLALKQEGDNQPRLCNALVHSNHSHAVLEIEAINGEDALDYFHFFDQVKAPIERLQRTQTLAELCDTVVQEVQKITGYDRVMVYRFHADGSGSVIAEAARDDVIPYLGLRYPSTDIPRQAKQLYTMSWLRIIPDISYEPVPLVSYSDSTEQRPLDMSEIGLRSVSSMHTEYLHNMGVQASLSISLLSEGRLWGLIACHHDSAKMVDMATRTCCEFVGQITSSELAAKERHEVLTERLHQKSVLTALGKSVAVAPTLAAGIVQSSDMVLNLVKATGAAYIEQDAIKLMGKTPTVRQVHQLIQCLKPHFHENAIYATPRLSQLWPDAQTYKSDASGVLGLAISHTQNIYLLWFRPELPQLVDWAGDPHKPESVDETGLPYLSPRKSFDRWVETVLNCSQAWGPAEIEIALELRSAIIGLVLQKADELAQVNLELTRSNDELASFAYVASHDLKAPLRAIANLACWIQEDLEGTVSDETQAQLDLLQSRVYRMHDMIQGLLQYSRVGDQASSIGIVSISGILKEILDSLSPPDSIEVKIPKLSCLYETNKTLLKQVLTNLISNAIKYIDRLDGKITIAVQEEPSLLRFEVSDNGPGIEPEYHDKIFQMFQTLQSRDEVESTGIGLAIVKKVITTQGGEICVQSVPGEGTTFAFTWPNISKVEDG